MSYYNSVLTHLKINHLETVYKFISVINQTIKQVCYVSENKHVNIYMVRY
ncbi:hypothetical protein [Gracilibacillus lacisalsi]|nr:hypothetical protein [Gracilibacillus lacisalsi]